MTNSLWPHGLQHARLPCPALSPKVCSNACPSSWCYLTISSSDTPFSFCLPPFPTWVFSSEVALCIRWLKYWSFSFSISPSNEYSGLSSFRIDWLTWSCCARDSQESSPTSLFKSINSLALSLLYSPTLRSIHDYWKIHSLHYTDLCQQNDISAF